MRINYNQSAVLSNSCLNRTENKLAASTERLSSGLKINHAKDNPAGFAISNRMDSQISGLSVASANTNDGISVVETADGALGEVTSILQRMSELAVQAGTETKTDDDRAIIDAEIQQLKDEIERIAKDTEFNGQTLLDGSFDLKGYTSNENVNVDYYSDEVKAGKYIVDLTGILNVENSDPIEYSVDKGKFTQANGFLQSGLKAVFENNKLTVSADANFEMTFDFDYDDTVDFNDPDTVADFVNSQGKITVDITGIGAMKIQVGANEGQEINLRIPEISLDKMGISSLKFTPDYDEAGNEKVSAFENAQKGIDQIKFALRYISEERARLGAYENRMEHNVTNLSVSSENMTSSYSRIMDIDMAEEMTEYSTQQILSQSGVSMLAQANQLPEKVLQLLQ